MKDKIKMIVFVLVLGSVLTVALVSVDAFTEPYIKANTRKKLQKSVLKAAGIDYEGKDPNTVFTAKITAIAFPGEMQDEDATEEEKKKFYRTAAGEYLFEYRGYGLQDEIYGVIAFKPDLATIKGVTIVSQKETPGLGGRIGEQQFLDRFMDRKIFPELRITKAGKAKGENEVDGLTGATLSCNAFEEILNSESRKYIQAIKESMK
jgi:Na+-transporting NADH:ubiquinone oxidoreductase subunit C